MALGGGTFVTQNKVLPGAYINFVSKARAINLLGDRGIVALPLLLNWGPTGEVITIDADEFRKESLNMLGYDIKADELKPLREIFKYAKSLKLFRLNGAGNKATATIGGLTITAKYSGTRGNDIKAVVQTNVDYEAKFDVITYIGLTRVDTQTVETISELQANNFVTFTGSTALEVTAGINLTGGTNGEVTGEEYSVFLDRLEAEIFHVVAYPGDDDLIKALFVEFVKRLRDEEGCKVQAVLYNYLADYEGVISVKNSQELVPWVAGATAGAGINQSLTNLIYNGEYEVNTKYKLSEFEKAIQNGELALYQDGDNVRVLSDVNTLKTYTPEKNEDFSSNRVIRVLDQIANDTARIFSNSYLGKVTNNDTGRTLFKNGLVNYCEQLQGLQAIEEFKQEDISISPGNGKKDVIVNIAIKPTDAMEKLYMSVEVQ